MSFSKEGGVYSLKDNHLDLAALVGLNLSYVSSAEALTSCVPMSKDTHNGYKQVRLTCQLRVR